MGLARSFARFVPGSLVAVHDNKLRKYRDTQDLAHARLVPAPISTFGATLPQVVSLLKTIGGGLLDAGASPAASVNPLRGRAMLTLSCAQHLSLTLWRSNAGMVLRQAHAASRVARGLDPVRPADARSALLSGDGSDGPADAVGELDAEIEGEPMIEEGEVPPPFGVDFSHGALPGLE